MDRRNHTATEEGGHIVMCRLAWLIVTLLLLVNFVSGMRPRYAELSKPCAATPCPYYAVHPTEARILADAGVSLRAYAGFHLLVELTLAGALTVLAINPLRERGFANFSDPKNVGELLTNHGVAVADAIYPVQIGGDLAALKGVIKALHEMERAAPNTVFDHAFIAAHTEGAEALLADVDACAWDDLEARSGLTVAQMREIAAHYARAKATMLTWCMGLTHHPDAVATIQHVVNLALLRGSVGRPGAGVVPVRGHSNVQGDRTMGAT